MVYRGRPGTFDHTAAYGNGAAMMVELVVDHGRTESPIRDMYPPGEAGLHHLAFVVDDLHETLKALVAGGYRSRSARARPAAPSSTSSTRLRRTATCSSSTNGRIGCAGFYAMVAAAARDWDGHDRSDACVTGSTAAGSVGEAVLGCAVVDDDRQLPHRDALLVCEAPAVAVFTTTSWYSPP